MGSTRSTSCLTWTTAVLSSRRGIMQSRRRGRRPGHSLRIRLSTTAVSGSATQLPQWDGHAGGTRRLRSPTPVAPVADGIPVVLAHRGLKPWAPGSPYLYPLVLEVIDAGGNILDSVYSYAGLRKVHVEGNQVYINNEPIFQRLVLDQGFYPDGIWTAPSDAALKRDIELAMAAGFNGARLHQKGV